MPPALMFVIHGCRGSTIMPPFAGWVLVLALHSRNDCLGKQAGSLSTRSQELPCETGFGVKHPTGSWREMVEASSTPVSDLAVSIYPLDAVILGRDRRLGGVGDVAPA